MIDFGIGQPELEQLPNDLLLKAANRLLVSPDNAYLNYGPGQGDLSLRTALAEFLGPHYGFAIDPQTLFMTGGASQALHLIAATFAQAGDTVLVEDPTYFLAPQIFRDLGLKVVGVPIGGSGLEPEALESAIREHRPKLLYTIPIHQNPSGVTIPEKHREALIEICRDQGVLIIADEVYQLLTYHGTPPPPLARQIASETLFSVSSFSKILAPGLRLGWIQASETLLAPLLRLGLLASGGGLNPFTGSLVEKVLDCGDQDRYLLGLKEMYTRKIDLMDRLLTEHLGDRVEYVKPYGGYFFWLKLNDSLNADDLQKLATLEEVGFRSGSRFSMTDRCGSYLRLSFAHYNDSAIVDGVGRLAKALEKLSSRSLRK